MKERMKEEGGILFRGPLRREGRLTVKHAQEEKEDKGNKWEMGRKAKCDKSTQYFIGTIKKKE